MASKLILIALIAIIAIIQICDSRLIYKFPRRSNSPIYRNRIIKRETPFGVNLHGERGGGGPTQYGGGIDYQGDRFKGAVDVNHIRGLGTDVTASAGANLWKSRDGNTRLDATGQYGQHFGGPFGKSKPNYGGFLNFEHRFGK